MRLLMEQSRQWLRQLRCSATYRDALSSEQWEIMGRYICFVAKPVLRQPGISPPCLLRILSRNACFKHAGRGNEWNLTGEFMTTAEGHTPELPELYDQRQVGVKLRQPGPSAVSRVATNRDEPRLQGDVIITADHRMHVKREHRKPPRPDIR